MRSSVFESQTTHVKTLFSVRNEPFSQYWIMLNLKTTNAHQQREASRKRGQSAESTHAHYYRSASSHTVNNNGIHISLSPSSSRSPILTHHLKISTMPKKFWKPFSIDFMRLFTIRLFRISMELHRLHLELFTLTYNPPQKKLIFMKVHHDKPMLIYLSIHPCIMTYCSLKMTSGTMTV